MNERILFEAFSGVDDRYLDMAEDTLKKGYGKKQHRTVYPGRFTSFLAAVICITLLAATAAAAGWSTGLFAELKESYPREEALFSAAAQANADAVPEIAMIPQADLSRLVMLERYFDGETILLGYDLEKALPEPLVGFEPEEQLLDAIRKGYPASRISWDSIEVSGKKWNIQKAEQYNLTEDAFVLDRVMQSKLTDEAYKKAWELLEEKGWVCIAVRDVYIGDTVLIDGQDIRAEYNSGTNAWSGRTEYESKLGCCLRLEPLPEAVRSREKVTVTLTARSNVEYWYMDRNGNGRVYFDPEGTESEEISFEVERMLRDG